jgi:hypothetical protein
VGHDIPIQELFDIIVGSGTGIFDPIINYQETLIFEGGIIALGIFRKEWSIPNAKESFYKLITAAFSKRSMLKLLWPLPGGSTSAQIMLNYLYKSEDLENALRATFGTEETLFGPSTSKRQTLNNIAVIATGEEEEKSFLLTNYNRAGLMNDDEGKEICTSFNMYCTI